jgi:hypothetical protein
MRLTQMSQMGWDVWNKFLRQPEGAISSGKDVITYARQQEFAQQVYTIHAAEATANLTKFIESLTLLGANRKICVTYFDESNMLGDCYRTLIRLLSIQETNIPMWYVLVGTRTEYRLDHRPATQREDVIRVEGV